MVVQKGADARVKLVSEQESGKLSGKAGLTVQLVSMTVDGKPVPVERQTFPNTADLAAHARPNRQRLWVRSEQLSEQSLAAEKARPSVPAREPQRAPEPRRL